MSYNPPGGQPPPYGYQQGPPGPGYAYVPTPVVVDPAHSQPVYVTNNFYKNQPMPVHVVDNNPPVAHDDIDWVPCTAAEAPQFAHRAVIAGKEGLGSSPLWVIRAHHQGDLIPGKLPIKHRAAYISHAGKEVRVHNFELMCASPLAVRWLPSSHGNVPVGAIPAGNTRNGEPLYVGRAKQLLSLTNGKVHPSHGCMYMPFRRREIRHEHYEVLCRIVG